MAILEGIARGELAVAEGRALDHDQAKARLARWLESSGRTLPSTREAARGRKSKLLGRPRRPKA